MTRVSAELLPSLFTRRFSFGLPNARLGILRKNVQYEKRNVVNGFAIFHGLRRSEKLPHRLRALVELSACGGVMPLLAEQTIEYRKLLSYGRGTVDAFPSCEKLIRVSKKLADFSNDCHVVLVAALL